AAVLPGDARRRILLLSDGRPTQGDALAEARALAAAGIRLDAVPLRPATGDDLAVRELRAPASARPGRPIAVEVAVTAVRETDARLRLYTAGTLAGSRQVRLQPGENRYVFQVTPSQPGPLPLRAEIEPLGQGTDAEPGNNRYHAVVEVTGTRPVLVLTPDPGGPLARALRSQGLQVDARGPGQRPADLAGWARYGAVFLENVPAHVLGERAMAELERFVHDLGGGLAMVGAPETFGPGGYLGTAVERALPVYMDLRAKKNLPTVAMVLVVDRSGSMQGVKLQMAVEAAMRAARLLTPKDRLGVVLFDSRAFVTREPAPVTSPDELRAAFPAQAEGGTSVGAGLLEAWELIRNVQADVRHVIVLTDGVSAPFDAEGTARQFREAGVTLSAVAIGLDADRQLLRFLARAGGGGYYEAADPEQVPSLITRDAVLATRAFLVDRPFVPVPATAPGRGGAAALLRGLVGEGGGMSGSESGGGSGSGSGSGPGLPPLGGYVVTSPKEQAEVLLVSDEQDPVLAAWRYGAGRALAWTSGTAGTWAGAWLGEGQDAYTRLWASAADWLLGRRAEPGGGRAEPAPGEGAGGGTNEGPGESAVSPPPAGVEAEVEPVEGGYQVRVRVRGTPPPVGRVRLVEDPSGGLEAPSGEDATGDREREAALLPVAPDRSEARLVVTTPGVYAVAVELPGGGDEGSEPGQRPSAAEPGEGKSTAEPVVVSTAVAVPYPAEFRNPEPDPAYLESLAAVTGGRLLGLEEGEAVLDAAEVPAPPGRRPLWPYLLALAAVLLPLDVTARRLGLSWRALARPAAWRGVPEAGTAEGVPSPAPAPAGPAAPVAPPAASSGASPVSTVPAAVPTVTSIPGATGAMEGTGGGTGAGGVVAEGGAASAPAISTAPATGTGVTDRLRAARERSRARTAERVRRHVGPQRPGPSPGP
ncbi:MAG TPA: VWA domain-containing protein, partial [Thermaerobacter sp.]